MVTAEYHEALQLLSLDVTAVMLPLFGLDDLYDPSMQVMARSYIQELKFDLLNYDYSNERAFQHTRQFGCCKLDQVGFDAWVNMAFPDHQTTMSAFNWTCLFWELIHKWNDNKLKGILPKKDFGYQRLCITVNQEIIKSFRYSISECERTHLSEWDRQFIRLRGECFEFESFLAEIIRTRICRKTWQYLRSTTPESEIAKLIEWGLKTGKKENYSLEYIESGA